MATMEISHEEVTGVARFAVELYNKEQNAKLRFVRAVDVTKQVLAGTEYSITVEATDDKIKKEYVAKVLESMGLKELVEFKLAPPKLST